MENTQRALQHCLANQKEFSGLVTMKAFSERWQTLKLSDEPLV